jgi:NTP pyrophosphatase (non-canonical NTP hydrolase)
MDFALNSPALQTAGQILNQQCHGAAVANGWWADPRTGQRIERNTGEMLMLTVSELAEGMEGDRKNLMDDKLPHRPMLEVELADAVIRIFDLAGSKGYDLGTAIAEKLAFNMNRPDHKPEARLAEGGKKY